MFTAPSIWFLRPLGLMDWKAALFIYVTSSFCGPDVLSWIKRKLLSEIQRPFGEYLKIHKFLSGFFFVICGAGILALHIVNPDSTSSRNTVKLNRFKWRGSSCEWVTSMKEWKIGRGRILWKVVGGGFGPQIWSQTMKSRLKWMGIRKGLLEKRANWEICQMKMYWWEIWDWS